MNKLWSNGVVTTVQGHDLHGKGFHLIHGHAHSRISLTFDLNKNGLRALDLGPLECREMGSALLQFARNHTLQTPVVASGDDYQI